MKFQNKKKTFYNFFFILEFQNFIKFYSKFQNFHKILKFSQNFKISKISKNFKIFKKIQNFHKTCSHYVHLC
jgi:hypothetical protein